MPAPTAISDTEISGLLKRVYANYRMHVQNRVTPLLAQLEKAKSGGPQNLRWGGAGVYYNVVVGRPAGSTFSASGYFPPDTTATEVQANVGIVRSYTTRQIDGLAFVGTQSRAAAFDTIAKKTMGEMREAHSLHLQQALHNKADGIVALIGSVGSTTSITVASPYGVASAGQGALCISVGDNIAVLDASDSFVTVLGRAQVTAISTSGDNSTLTLGTAISGMASTDAIVKATASDTSYNAAMHGLISITNRGAAYNNLCGINASTYPIWSSINLTAGTHTDGGADNPGEQDLWRLTQRVAGSSGKDANTRPNEFLLLTTPGIGDKLMQNYLGQRRFTAGEVQRTIKGGYRAYDFNGMPLVMDYYVPAGTIYLIHLPSLAWVDAKDAGFIEFEGAGPWRWLNGRDAFETTYGMYTNLAPLQRNSHGVIVGYTDTQRYSHL